MRRPNLFFSVGIAGVLSLIALAIVSLIPWPWHWSSHFQVLIAILTFLYLLFLLGCTSSRIGRFSLGVCSAAILASSVALGFSWPLVLAISVGLIWIVRVLYAYSSLMGAFVDAGLCVLSMGWACAAFASTGSVIWAIWCFFLAQGLYVLIPEKRSAPEGEAFSTDSFARAHSTANAAFQQLVRRS